MAVLVGTYARELEELLGLEPSSRRDVRRSRDGKHYILRFAQQQFAGRWCRSFRIPAKRVHGYQQRSATVHPYNARYRANASRRWFAIWLTCWWIADPVVDRAFNGDLGAVDELRAAILLAADGGSEHVEFWLAGWAS